MCLSSMFIQASTAGSAAMRMHEVFVQRLDEIGTHTHMFAWLGRRVDGACMQMVEIRCPCFR